MAAIPVRPNHHPPFRRVPQDQRGLSSVQRTGSGAPLPQKRRHGGIKAEAWRRGETSPCLGGERPRRKLDCWGLTRRAPQSFSPASLRAAKGQLRTMGLPTQRAPPGTEGPQIAHRVNAMETTL
eukprot:3270410-Pyramimonas_sp.AAC.1